MTITSGSWRWRTTGASTGTPNGDTERAGLEHVEVKVAETNVSAEGVAIGGAGWATRWRMVIDTDWTSVRSLHLTRLGGPTVALRHDGYGEWSDGEGRRRPEFASLTDCLVEGSPFGLIALLQRLGAKASKAQSVDVVTVSVPDFAIARATVALKPSDGGRRIALTIGETSEPVVLDADGIVVAWGDRIARIEAETTTKIVVPAAE
jgi:hypothetical protein